MLGLQAHALGVATVESSGRIRSNSVGLNHVTNICVMLS